MDTLAQGPVADRYRLEGLVGEGGMGAVYRAVDQRTARTVAVKIIREAGARDQRMIRLFNREIRAVARLNHPGVVQVLDHGLDASDRPFYVMEFVSGCSLAQLPVETFTWADVRFIIESLLRTLAYAHARGVVHRDLKPENILITAAPERAVKLVDFGIAKISEEVETAGHVVGTTEAPTSAKANSTLLGGTVGTPAYMAPEQAQGRSRQIGPATDLYAVGCLIHQLVSGRLPFDGPTPMAVIVQRLTQGAPPLTLRSGKAPPEALQALVADLLVKSPWRRPPCAADVRSRLLEVPDFELEQAGAVGSTSPTVVDTGPPPLVSPTGPRIVRRDHSPDNRFRLLSLKSPPLVGREDLQRTLFGSCVELLEAKRSGLLVLQGPRGIGKRRLGRWLKEVLSERGLVTPLEIRHTGGAEQAVIEAINEALARSLALDLADPATWDEAAQLMAEGPDGVVDSSAHRRCRSLLWAWFGPKSAQSAVASGEDADRLRMRLDVLLGVLDLLRRDKPLLISFESMHRVDGEALARLVAHLLETDRLRDWPIIVVGTFVPDGEEGLAPLLKSSRCQCLTVPRLDSQQSEALLTALLPLESGARTTLRRHAGGSPYWLVRLVRELSQAGLLFESGDQYWIADEGERWLARGKWGDDLARRVQRMAAGADEDERWVARVLCAASLLGQAPDVELLSQMLVVTDTAAFGAVERAIDHWIGDGVLVEAEEGRVRFEHGLAHSALLAVAEAMAEAPRWHQIAAEALMIRERQRQRLAGEIGRHLEAAGDARAVDWLLNGAELAMAEGRYKGALDLFTRIRRQLDGVEADHPRQIRLAIGLGRLAVRRLDADLYSQSMEMLDEAQPGTLGHAWAAFVEGQWMVAHGEPTAGARALFAAVARFEDLGATADGLRARERLADELRRRGRYDEALSALEHAHEQAAIGGFTELAAQLTLLAAFIELETSRYGEALAKARAIYQSPAAQRSAWLEARALFLTCGALLRLDRPDEAVVAGERALSLYRRTGDLTGEMTLLNVLAMCEQDRGRPGPSLALAREALALSERLGAVALRGRILNNLALACEALGRQGEARRCLQQSLVASHVIEDAQNEARVCHNLAEHCARAEDPEALIYARRAVQILERLELPYVDEAREMMTRLEAHFGEAGRQVIEGYDLRLEQIYEGHYTPSRR